MTPTLKLFQHKRFIPGQIQNIKYFLFVAVDANNNPHIAWFLKRDTNEGTASGNFAVMYAVDLDGDGSFDVSQVSTNANDPNLNEDNIFDCYVNGPPYIIFKGSDVIVSYISESYPYNVILATKSGSSWNHEVGFAIDGENQIGGNYYLPNKFNEFNQTGCILYMNETPSYVSKINGVWQSDSIVGYTFNEYYGGTEDMKTVIDNNGVTHILWFYAEGDDRYCHTTLDNTNYSSVEETILLDSKAGNHQLATVDLTTGIPVYFYQEAWSYGGYLITLDGDNNSTETFIEETYSTPGRNNTI